MFVGKIKLCESVVEWCKLVKYMLNEHPMNEHPIESVCGDIHLLVSNINSSQSSKPALDYKILENLTY